MPITRLPFVATSTGDHPPLMDKTVQTVGPSWPGEVDIADHRRPCGLSTGVLVVVVPYVAKMALKEAASF